MRTAFLEAVSLCISCSVMAADAPLAKAWSGSVGAGLAPTSGNTDTQSRRPRGVLPFRSQGDRALFAALLFKY